MQPSEDAVEAVNPFALMTAPEAVFAALERSDRLARLKSTICRPLDKPRPEKPLVELRAVASFVPLDRCLIETDSPYLAPMPLRGKLNTPANVPLVAAKLAEVKGLPVERIAEATTANFGRLFPGTVPRSSSVS